MCFLLVTICLLLMSYAHGGVLILSPKRTEVSGLKPFDIESYRSLQATFKKYKIIAVKVNGEQIPDDCERSFQSKFTSYVPTVTYVPQDVIYIISELISVLKTSRKQSCDDIKKTLGEFDLDKQKNVVYLLIHDAIRNKRDAQLTTDSVAVTTELAAKEKADKVVVSKDEPVLYNYTGKWLLFSSRALYLQLQNDSGYYLGSATFLSVDERDSFSRLICTISIDEKKVILRFRFPWENGYWSLTSVEVLEPNGKIYNLTISTQITAPKIFSYRCGGETVFTDGVVSLTLYDLQVQPAAKNGRFSDAYNCVPFMTGPIWSGIFVSALLAVGLIIGLSALGSIKTMDKFDNSKTKQLTITIMGE